MCKIFFSFHDEYSLLIVLIIWYVDMLMFGMSRYAPLAILFYQKGKNNHKKGSLDRPPCSDFILCADEKKGWKY